MTDAHCHLVRGETRHFVCGDGAIGPVDVRFCGLHPWEFLHARELPDFGAIERRLADDSHLGVGEIGLDRLKVRDIPQMMSDAFEAQLAATSRAAWCQMLGASGEGLRAVCREDTVISLSRIFP